MSRYKHYGWPVSPYTAKTRAFFLYKSIPFDDIRPTARQLMGPIKKAVGAAIMPTVQAPDGTWMQDSSAIIDTLEAQFPERAVVPTTPRQRVVSLLLELFGDEWLIPLAIHYRWNYPANAEFGVSEFAAYALPWLPKSVGRALVRPVAKKMSSYREMLGITSETVPGFESFAETLFDRLDTHLKSHLFLLGSRPSIADFAMFATPWAHVYRDPGTAHFFDDRPACQGWFERLNMPSTEPGEFWPDDAIPDTLLPILELMFSEQLPYLRSLVSAIDQYCEEHPDATRVPRSLGFGEFSISGIPGTRKLITFSQWMAQRPLAAYHALDDAERASVDALLEPFGGLNLTIANPFERVDFKMRLAGRSPSLDGPNSGETA